MRENSYFFVKKLLDFDENFPLILAQKFKPFLVKNNFLNFGAKIQSNL